jgi:hypothetical protein
MKTHPFILTILILFLFACQTEKEQNEEDFANEPQSAGNLESDFEESGFKWGYVNKKGRLIIKASFDECKNFSDGLAVIRVKGKWGYIDKTGKMTVPPQFQEAYDFSESRAIVKKYGSKYSIIDSNGNMLTEDSYDEIKSYSDGLAAVRIKNNWTYIDLEGNELDIPKFSKAYPFKNGLAKVNLGGRYGIINKDLKFVVEAEMDKISDLNSYPILVKQDDKQWYIDRSGKKLFEVNYAKAYKFHYGYATVKDNGLKGIIDEKNNLIIPLEHQDIQVVGPDLFQVFKAGKFGIINAEGTSIIPTEMDLILPIREGKTACMKDELWAIYTASGKQLTAFEFGMVWSFQEEMARVAFLNGIGFIDSNGKVVIDPLFFDVNDFSEGLARVQVYE